MNQNWIVENLNNAFSTWNGKLGELWGLVTTGPQTFKGGAVWSVMQTLHNGTHAPKLPTISNKQATVEAISRGVHYIAAKIKKADDTRYFLVDA